MVDPVMQGYVEKQSPSVFKRWQKRYFVLKHKIIRYYKKEEDYRDKKVPKGVVNLNMIWVEPKFVPASLRIDLEIVGTNRVFYLKCYNQD